MSVKLESVFVARLQKRVTYIQVTRAINASVKALGYAKVRQEQFDVILNFLKGNDVFVSLPTGGGKSLCYACLPYVYDHLRDKTSSSIAIVISPLNALMQDQVTSFTKRGMTAVHVGKKAIATHRTNVRSSVDGLSLVEYAARTQKSHDTVEFC